MISVWCTVHVQYTNTKIDTGFDLTEIDMVNSEPQNMGWIKS